MKVIMFKQQFSELVRSGKKTRTIRPARKRPLLDGEMVSLRMWTCRPYNSPQVELGRGIITLIRPVIIGYLHVKVAGEVLSHQARDEFAKADGFSGVKEFVDWFDNVHGLPFEGLIIEWVKLMEKEQAK